MDEQKLKTCANCKHRVKSIFEFPCKDCNVEDFLYWESLE